MNKLMKTHDFVSLFIVGVAFLAPLGLLVKHGAGRGGHGSRPAPRSTGRARGGVPPASLSLSPLSVLTSRDVLTDLLVVSVYRGLTPTTYFIPPLLPLWRTRAKQQSQPRAAAVPSASAAAARRSGA